MSFKKGTTMIAWIATWMVALMAIIALGSYLLPSLLSALGILPEH